jgi:hypothetical protein
MDAYFLNKIHLFGFRSTMAFCAQATKVACKSGVWQYYNV